jgi:CDP-diacylglycerol--inositol 3-phosphatidyltransferase
MASSVPTKPKVTEESQKTGSLKAFFRTNNIFLYVPNIIGYIRVILSIASFYFMPTHPNLTVVCYLTSGFLDALDGHAARVLDQCKFIG